MNTKAFGVAGALLALALMIGLVVGTSSISAKSTPPGSVFITGHDPDYHSHPDEIDFENKRTEAQNLLRIAIEFAKNGSAKPLLVVHPEDYSSIPAGHNDSIVGLETVVDESDYVRMNATQFIDADLTPELYSAIYVASDAGGLFSQDELDELNKRKKDIRRYVNQGGGLVALAESNGGAHLTPNHGEEGREHFGFLPFPVGSSALPHFSNGTEVTAFGASLGLTNEDVESNFSHNYFLETETGGMEVVDRNVYGNIMSLAYQGYFGPDGIVVGDEDGKVKICHHGNPTDTYHVISVPYNTAMNHMAGHGDEFPYEDGSCPAP